MAYGSQIYLLNTPILTAYGDFRFTGPIKSADANQRISPGFISAIGHETSATLLSRILSVKVPVNRIAIAMMPGDQALVFRVTQRLPEGKVLTEQDMASITYELAWLEHLV